MRGGVRAGFSALLLVVVGIALPIGLVLGWANETVYDSGRFSARSVDILNSPAVRREVAAKLTEQLALGGNREAVNFRPAFQLAVEAAVDTDTFRSIFGTAVRRTHEALLAGQGGGAALDLSDSVAIITSTLSLPSTAQPGQPESATLGSSLSDVTSRLAELRVWELEDLTATARWVALALALGAAIAAVAIGRNRHRVVRVLGVVIVLDGLLVAAVVPVVQWYADSRIDDPALADAVRGALGRGMADLTSIGLWTAGYGVVVAAAATAMAADAQRLTPKHVAGIVGGWIARARRSTLGTVAIGVVAIGAGLLLVQNAWFWALVGVIGTGLWLAYFGLTEILGLVRTATVDRRSPEHRGRLVAAGGVVVIAAALVTTGLVVSTSGASDDAEAAGRVRCNGDAANCDRPLNLMLLPGTHNSMSSTLYPGWLFAEQVRTIRGQLDAGARALLFDTHYGVPSSARLPGSDTPVILTDRAAELVSPTGEDIDPAIAARAEQLATRAPAQAGAARSIYLCHNYCELGAVPFSDVLAEIKGFIDTHPEDVVLIIIQDATTPADTSAAITAAGLADEAYTLDRSHPLPTLGEMIDSGRTLLVFAEGGGSGAPPWYQPAYDHWFQETAFKFSSVDVFSCAPNRGPVDAPLFLVNHWIEASPPDPSIAGRANATDVLQGRLRQCLQERGRVPNVVALDFAAQSGALNGLSDFGDQLIEDFQALRDEAAAPSSTPAPAVSTTVASSDGSATSTTVASATTLPTIDAGTSITSLTAGDPGAFCAALDPMLQAVSAWAVASWTSTDTTRGQSDLAFGPVADRTLRAALDPAPAEIAARLQGLATRAAAAVEALHQLGLDDDDIATLADHASSALDRPDSSGPLVVEQALIDEVGSSVGDDQVTSAALAFNAANPEPAGLFDLGEVPADVASAAGYDCLGH